MRKVIHFALVVFVASALSGCGSSAKPQELIVGKWRVSQSAGIITLTGTAEFRKNGTVTTEMSGMKIESTYTFLDDKNIEVEMSVRGKKMTEKNRIASLSRDEMVLVDPQGGRAEFTRIK